MRALVRTRIEPDRAGQLAAAVQQTAADRDRDKLLRKFRARRPRSAAARADREVAGDVAQAGPRDAPCSRAKCTAGWHALAA